MVDHTGVEEMLLIAADNVSLSGVAAGGALIRASGVLHASGVVSGPLTIETGGRAYVSGVLTGPVSIFNDALLEITGILDGDVLQNDGQLVAAVGAVIHGRRLSPTGTFVDSFTGTSSISPSTQRFELNGTGSHIAVGQPI
jgi:hypothetical protein